MTKFVASFRNKDYAMGVYIGDDGKRFSRKWVAIKSSNPSRSNESLYFMYLLNNGIAEESGISVAINERFHTAYVERANTDLPKQLAERFVNLITHRYAFFEAESTDWFEFNLSEHIDGN